MQMHYHGNKTKDRKGNTENYRTWHPVFGTFNSYIAYENGARVNPLLPSFYVYDLFDIWLVFLTQRKRGTAKEHFFC